MIIWCDFYAKLLPFPAKKGIGWCSIVIYSNSVVGLGSNQMSKKITIKGTKSKMKAIALQQANTLLYYSNSILSCFFFLTTLSCLVIFCLSGYKIQHVISSLAVSSLDNQKLLQHLFNPFPFLFISTIINFHLRIQRKRIEKKSLLYLVIRKNGFF